MFLIFQNFLHKRGLQSFNLVFVFQIMAIFLLGFYLIGGVMLNTIIVDIQNGPASKFTRNNHAYIKFVSSLIYVTIM